MSVQNSLLVKQAQALIDAETDLIAITANLSALLFNSLEHVNWLGFYFLKDNELILGPFQGQVACTRIPVGQGVCGTAFYRQQTLRVADVHAFDGHIACDAASESEIVIPFESTKISGVLDVDSPIKDRFSREDQMILEAIVALLAGRLDLV